MENKQDGLSRRTVMLHWAVAAMFFFMIALGWYMTDNEAYQLYSWHKSIGVVTLLLVLFRIFWRISEGWEGLSKSTFPVENMMARLVHWCLLLITVLLPVTGIVMSVAGGGGLVVLGLDLIPSNIDQATGETVAINSSLSNFSHSVHLILPWTFTGLLMLHVCAALKHHVLDKSNVLKNMLRFK